MYLNLRELYINLNSSRLTLTWDVFKYSTLDDKKSSIVININMRCI